jgi:hypothetical protein
VLGGRVAGHLRRAALGTARWLSPAKPVLANLVSVPLFVAGLGCLDAAAFVGNLIAGLAVTGVSLIVLENVIADED